MAVNTNSAKNSNSANIYIRKFTEFTGYKGKPLSGLKFVIKDMIAVESYPLTFGLNPPYKVKSEKTANVVKHLLENGASLIGSTNLDPAAMGISGKNPYYGNMGNPINSSIPLGGSSGGAAVAVATGEADFAVVSDHGGSARMPASLCGINGIKLSTNLIDQNECVLLDDDFDGLGLIGPDPDILEKVLSSFHLKKIKKLTEKKILIPMKSDLSSLNKSIRDDFENLSIKLKDTFEIKEIGIELKLEEMSKLRKIIISRLFLERIKAYGTENLPEELKAIFIYAQGITISEYSKANEKVFEYRAKVRTVLNDTALLTPLFPVQKDQIETFDGRINIFMNLANLCGLPAINLEKPITLQLIGAEFSEISLCKLAVSIGNI